MAVALLDHILSIQSMRQGPGLECASIRAQSHRPAFVLDRHLRFHRRNSRMGWGLTEHQRISGRHSWAGREFYNPHLHSEADSEVGDLAFPGKLHRGHLSLGSAHSKAAGDQYRMDIREKLGGALGL